MNAPPTHPYRFVMPLASLCSGWVTYFVLALTLWIACQMEGGSESGWLMALFEPMATTGNRYALHLWQYLYAAYVVLLVPGHMALALRGETLMKPTSAGGVAAVWLFLGMLWSATLVMHIESPQSAVDQLLKSPLACAGLLSFQALITTRWLAHLLMPLRIIPTADNSV